MRTRNLSALVAIGALTLAACGGDADDAAVAPAAESSVAAPATSDEMSGDEMSDDEMSDDEMSDDEMSGDEMSGDEMSGDEMSDDEMSDDEMSDDEMSDDEMSDDMSDGGDVQSIINGRPDLSTFDAVLHSTGLDDLLHGDGAFIVFAPTDEAFAAYLGEMGMTADDVVAEGEALRSLVEGHIVAATESAEMVMGVDGQVFTALAGGDLAVAVDGDTVTLNGVTISEYDVVGTNGVIHVIDGVLAPAG